MSYRVTRSPDNRLHVELGDEPAYCRALDAGPPAREPELGTGRWLILLFAAWSMSDVAAIQTALDVARRFGGKLVLGLRPFETWEEHDTWMPDLEEDGKTPIWILLRDGEVRMKRSGLFDADALVQEIEAADPV